MSAQSYGNSRLVLYLFVYADVVKSFTCYPEALPTESFTKQISAGVRPLMVSWGEHGCEFKNEKVHIHTFF